MKYYNKVMLIFEVLSVKTAANFNAKMRERYFLKRNIIISVTQEIIIIYRLSAYYKKFYILFNFLF